MRGVVMQPARVIKQVPDKYFRLRRLVGVLIRERVIDNKWVCELGDDRVHGCVITDRVALDELDYRNLIRMYGVRFEQDHRKMLGIYGDDELGHAAYPKHAVRVDSPSRRVLE